KNSSNDSGSATKQQRPKSLISAVVYECTQVVEPVCEEIGTTRCVVRDEVREGVEHPVNVAKRNRVDQQDQAEDAHLDRRNTQHPNVTGADEGLVDGNEKADQQDYLTKLDRDRHDVRSVDAVKSGTEELLVVEHPTTSASARR